MKKHIIIAGASRSGKTTLAIELAKCGYVHYKMDSIKRGICDIFGLDQHDWKGFSPIVAKLMNVIIKENNTDTVSCCERYVLDTPHLFPSDVSLIEPENVIVIFMGYAHTKSEDVLLNIRKYDKDSYWSKDLTDEELLKMSFYNIEFSKHLENVCKKLGIPYFDTSVDRESIIEEIKEYIDREQEK